MFKTNVTITISSREPVGATQAAELAHHLDDVKDVLNRSGLLVTTGEEDQCDLYYGDNVYESAYEITESIYRGVRRNVNCTISRAFLLVSDLTALASVELLVNNWIADNEWERCGRFAGPFLFEIESTSWFTLLPQTVE